MPTIGWTPRGPIAGMEFYRDQRETQQTSDLGQAESFAKLQRSIEELDDYLYERTSRRKTADVTSQTMDAYLEQPELHKGTIQEQLRQTKSTASRSQAQDRSITNATNAMEFSNKLDTMKDQQAWDAYIKANPQVRNQRGFSPVLTDMRENQRKIAVQQGNVARMWQQAPQLRPDQINTGVDWQTGLVTGQARDIDPSTGQTINQTSTAEPIPGYAGAMFGGGGSTSKINVYKELTEKYQPVIDAGLAARLGLESVNLDAGDPNRQKLNWVIAAETSSLMEKYPTLRQNPVYASNLALDQLIDKDLVGKGDLDTFLSRISKRFAETGVTLDIPTNPSVKQDNTAPSQQEIDAAINRSQGAGIPPVVAAHATENVVSPQGQAAGILRIHQEQLKQMPATATSEYEFAVKEGLSPDEAMSMLADRYPPKTPKAATPATASGAVNITEADKRVITSRMSSDFLKRMGGKDAYWQKVQAEADKLAYENYRNGGEKKTDQYWIARARGNVGKANKE